MAVFSAASARLDFMGDSRVLGDALVEGQRLPDHLVHVVVLVGAQPAEEGDTRRLVGQRLVAPVQLGVLRTGHRIRSEEHTSELQSRENLVCRLLLEKKKPLFSTPDTSLILLVRLLY